MERTFQVINQMQEDGVIQNYAIGGAIAALFYVEPDTTFDLDVYCVSSVESGSGVDFRAPIYSYLREKRYIPAGASINLEGLLVQFLPVSNPLTEEGVDKAKVISCGQTPVRVMTPEHLVAIMLETGRAQDYARIIRFVESDAVDIESLGDILSRHNLSNSWEEFRSRLRK